MDEAPRRIRKTGGYRNLRSFQITTFIHDGTVAFCKNFVDFKSRTEDPMVQAARSGRQQVEEGSRAGAVSSHSELLLTNVARASKEELLLDQQLLAMEQSFISEGGYKEQLASARIAERNKPDESSPKCEDCGKPMSLRTARQGKNEGSQFWGCSGYPECKKTMPV